MSWKLGMKSKWTVKKDNRYTFNECYTRRSKLKACNKTNILKSFVDLYLHTFSIPFKSQHWRTTWFTTERPKCCRAFQPLMPRILIWSILQYTKIFQELVEHVEFFGTVQVKIIMNFKQSVHCTNWVVLAWCNFFDHHNKKMFWNCPSSKA